MQSQYLLMPAKLGTLQKPRSGWVNDSLARNQLLGKSRTPTNTTNTTSSSIARNAQKSLLTMQRSLAAQEAHTQAMALEQAIAAEQAAYTGDALLTGQSIIQKASQDLLQDTRDLKKTAAETLTVSRRIETRVRDIQAILRTPGGAGTLMLNPFFALVVFFITHPYLPVTVETAMPVWSVLLSINFVKSIVMKVRSGETLISLEGGMLGVVKGIVFNAPHAIVMMYKLSTAWTQERTGVRGYTARNAAMFSATMESSNWEPFIAAQFFAGMETMRNFSLASLAETRVPIPQVNVSEWRAYLESASSDVYRDIQQLDPDLFTDKAGCIQLILEYAMGKLVVKGRSIAAATLNMPAYLHQMRTVLGVEQWIFQCLFHLVKDIFVRFFKDLWEDCIQYICTALCIYAPPTRTEIMVEGGGFGNWISSATGTITTGAQEVYTRTATAVVSGVSTVTTRLAAGATAARAYASEIALESILSKLATWGCNCEKPKMNGGNISRKSGSRKSGIRKRSTRKSRASVVPTDHVKFVLTAWRFVLYTLAPVLTGIPLIPTHPALLALDAEMRDLLLQKVAAGHFVPPILLRNVDVGSYLGNTRLRKRIGSA